MPDINISPIDLFISGTLNRSSSDLAAEDLEAFQLSRIRTLIRRLKEKSRYYAKTLAGISADDIRTMADFRSLPVTTEADLAENESAFQCISPKEVERIITVPTTGTHGKSKHIAFTLSDLALALRFSRTAFTTFCQEGDRLLVFMSGNTAGGVGDSIRRSLAPLNTETCVYGAVKNIPEAFRFMEEYRPDIVVGIPVQMAALAAYGLFTGSSFSVRNVLLSSDDVPDAVCERLRKYWSCEPFRHFGMTETCLMGGCECRGHCGYHMRSTDHLFEVIDPDQDGYGELAVTTFSHEAMPLLRYKTGDIAKMSTGPCKCGGKLPRIENVKGRLSNSFVSRGRRIFLRDLEEILFSFDAVIDFECELSRHVLRIGVKTLPGVSADLSLLEKELSKITEDDISFELSSSETLDFNLSYNAKKTL